MAPPRSSSLASRGLRFLALTNKPSLQNAAPRMPRLAPARAAADANRFAVSPIRPFCQTSSLLKKRKIAPASNSPPRGGDNHQPPTPAPTSKAKADNASSSSQPDPENPLDFSSLAAAYGPLDSHFKAQLQALLHGGRFNPDSLGALPVPVKASSEHGGGTTSYPLRELAQVVPRSGRTISLLVNDRAYVKPIMSAVQASGEFNQQPQHAEDNDLELLLKVELERKEDLVRRVKDACQGWRDRVRQARAKHEKYLKDWKRSGAVLPDMIKKADKELQKLQDKKMKDIDQEEAQTVKQLDRS